MPKTEQDMNLRLSQLRGLLERHELTLRLSAELDAIQNHGLKGWTDFLNKRRKGK